MDKCLKSGITAKGILRNVSKSKFIPIGSQVSEIQKNSKHNALFRSILRTCGGLSVLKKSDTTSNLFQRRARSFIESESQSGKSHGSLGLNIPVLQISGKKDGNIPASPSEAQLKQEKLIKFSKICSKITDNIFLSGEEVASNLELLKENNITHVLNCAGHYCSNFFQDEFEYLKLDLYDGKNEDVSCFFLLVIEYLQSCISKNGKVLIHCQQGVSRSSSFLIMYLMWCTKMPFVDVFEDVKLKRGICNPNTGFIYQLLMWEKRLGLKGPREFPWLLLISPHGESDLTFVARTMEVKLSSFDQRGVYLLETKDTIYKWIGSKATPLYIKNADVYIKRLQTFLNSSENVVTIHQDKQESETQEFKDLIGGSLFDITIQNSLSNFLSLCSEPTNNEIKSE